ncbi:MAG: hypothetical protein IKT22_07245, partial [Prevotella sp.]|nr:hypothetical protein [Prevotella sp.]
MNAIYTSFFQIMPIAPYRMVKELNRSGVPAVRSAQSFPTTAMEPPFRERHEAVDARFFQILYFINARTGKQSNCFFMRIVFSLSETHFSLKTARESF